LLAAAFQVPAVESPTIRHVGNTPPSYILIAPGQITTVFVSPPLVGESVFASGFPLPTELAGISVFLEQAADSPQPTALPLLSVELARDDLTAITVQIPYNIAIGQPPGSHFFGPPETWLEVRKAGQPTPRIRAFPVSSSVHVLTNCDTMPYRFIAYPRYPWLSCRSLVTHADGSLVTQAQPARAGEILTMYATGLGEGWPPGTVTAGEAPATPVAFFPVSVDFWRLDFDFGPNAVPTVRNPPGTLPKPLYMGLVAGYAGLYQINFQLPREIPAGTPPCGPSVICNLTVNVLRWDSFDGALICVQ
jgi:uncharacterized protein (TIGR03437 family)